MAKKPKGGSPLKAELRDRTLKDELMEVAKYHRVPVSAVVEAQLAKNQGKMDAVYRKFVSQNQPTVAV